MKTKLEELLAHLDKIEQPDKIIIVEGKKDVKALNKLGILNVISLRSEPSYMIVEKVANSSKTAIILTDLDREGKKHYARLRRDLSLFGVKIDNRFREFLFSKTRLRQIEGLPKYIEHISPLHRL